MKTSKMNDGFLIIVKKTILYVLIHGCCFVIRIHVRVPLNVHAKNMHSATSTVVKRDYCRDLQYYGICCGSGPSTIALQGEEHANNPSHDNFCPDEFRVWIFGSYFPNKT
ncbi:unnamed protein product [Amaranthus hypochondriacus]